MRLGIDLGGTKIEIAAIEGRGEILYRERVATPQSDYGAVVSAIGTLVRDAETKLGRRGSLGVAIPGALSQKTGLVKNSNSTRLNDHPLDKDLAAALARPVRIANDANCFTLSEATDGAAEGMDVVFGIIAGTGVGGGICMRGRALSGAHAIAGEWGHNPLPAPGMDETRGPLCHCGRHGCIESWLSGPALATQFQDRTGRQSSATEIAAAAQRGEPDAAAVMERFFDRFARAISTLVNILDPDAIVIGGGLSNIDALYRELPSRIMAYAYQPEEPPRILKNLHGDSSGVRGAAWLWREDEIAAALPA